MVGVLAVAGCGCVAGRVGAAGQKADGADACKRQSCEFDELRFPYGTPPRWARGRGVLRGVSAIDDRSKAFFAIRSIIRGGSRFGRKPQDKGAIRSLMPPAVDFAGGLARLARLQALRCRSDFGGPLSPGFDFSLAASSLASFLGLCPPAAYSHCVCCICACLADTPAYRGFSRRLCGLGICCRIVTLYISAFIMQKLSKIVLIQGRPIMRVQSL